MTKRKARRPSIPSFDDPRAFADAVQEALGVGMGQVGDPLDRWATLRDIQEAGLSGVDLSGRGSLTGPSGGSTPGNFDQGFSGTDPDPYGENDTTKPPRPTNVQAVGLSLDSIGVRWDPPAYNNHSYAEVFAAAEDNINLIRNSFNVNAPTDAENGSPYLVGKTSSNLFIHQGQASTVPTPVTRYETDSATIVVRNYNGTDERQLEVRLSLSDDLDGNTFRIGDAVVLRSDDENDLAGAAFEVAQIQLGQQGAVRELYLRTLPSRYTEPLAGGGYASYTYTPGVWIEKVFSTTLTRPIMTRFGIVSSSVLFSSGQWLLRLNMDLSAGNQTPTSAVANGETVSVRDLTRSYVFNSYRFTVQSFTVSGGQYISSITLSGIPQSYQDQLTAGSVIYAHREGIELEVVDDAATAAQTESELDEALSPGTIYYWVRFVSAASIVGDFQSDAGVPGTVMLDPERILNALTQQVSSTQLSQSLLNPIAFVSGPISERNPDGSRKYPTIADFVASLGDERINEYDQALDEVFLGFLGGTEGDLAFSVVEYGRESLFSPRIYIKILLPDDIDPATQSSWARDRIFARDGETPQTDSRWRINTQDDQLALLRWNLVAGAPTPRYFWPETVTNVLVDDGGRNYALVTLRGIDGSADLPELYYDSGELNQQNEPILLLYDYTTRYSIAGRTSFIVNGTPTSDWQGIATAAAYVNQLRGQADEFGAFMDGLESWQAGFEETTAEGVFQILATIQQRRLVSATDSGALAYIRDSVQVEMDLDGDGDPELYGLNEMASSVVADNHGRLTNSWTVRMNQFTNGQLYAAGFGLSMEPGLSGRPVSSFIVSADQFAIQGTVDRTRRIEEWLRVTDSSVIGKEIWIAVRGRPHLGDWSAEPELNERPRLVVSLPPLWRAWEPVGYDAATVEGRLNTLRRYEYVLFSAYESGSYPKRDPITGAQQAGIDERWVMRLRLANDDGTVTLPQPPPLGVSDLIFEWDDPAESAVITNAVSIPFIVDTTRNVVGIRGSLVVDGMISTQELEVSRLLRANRIWARYMQVAGLEADSIITGKMATRRTSGWALRIQQPTAANGRKVLQVGRFTKSVPEIESGTYTDDVAIDPFDYVDDIGGLESLYPQLQNEDPSEETFYITDQGKVFARGSLEVAGGALFHLDIEAVSSNFDYMVRMDHMVPLAVARKTYFLGNDGQLIQPTIADWLTEYGTTGGTYYATNLDRLERNALFWTNVYGEAGFNTSNNAIYVDDDPLALASGTGGVAGAGVGVCSFRPVRRLAGGLARMSCMATVSYGVVDPTSNRRFRGISYALWIIPKNAVLPSTLTLLPNAVNFRVVRFVGIDTVLKRDYTYEAYQTAMNSISGAVRVCEVFDGSASQYATLSGVVDVVPNQEYRLYMVMVERYGIDSTPSDFAQADIVYSEAFWMQQISASDAAGSPKATGGGANPLPSYPYPT